MGDTEVDRNDMSNSRTTDRAEESSWTMYLGDFLIDNKKKSSLISSENNSSSLVSDATSSITRVFADATRTISCKRVSFKKKESRDSIIQDALEDTASSLNCPKAKESTLDRAHLRKDLVLIARDDVRGAMKESSPRLAPPSTYGGEAQVL
ncbi:vascular-related unknown protein 1-like [Syzygium oleosum]|uniref:vascular-related unknown protein 1-like n=1 Tax=Syzygium oleosum TaxID=219896 RepID=UPI0024B96EF4|nr:vascular-related unknown protein 1-like [Syzygium oleosum]